MRRIFAGSALLAMTSALGGGWGVPLSAADATAYLVNVTVRPGYNFPDASAALTYGQGLCDKVSSGEPFAHLVAETMSDFSSAEEYQATYLISQAVNELCPQYIWQLRNSAAHYVGPAA